MKLNKLQRCAINNEPGADSRFPFFGPVGIFGRPQGVRAAARAAPTFHQPVLSTLHQLRMR